MTDKGETLPLGDEEFQRLTIESGKVSEFQDINAAFAILAFGDEGLGLVQRPRDLNLRQASGLAGQT